MHILHPRLSWLHNLLYFAAPNVQTSTLKAIPLFSQAYELNLLQYTTEMVKAHVCIILQVVPAGCRELLSCPTVSFFNSFFLYNHF
jgi:hypothetical protein